MQFPAKGALGSKNFIKLKDGESVVVVFQGTPYDFKQHWLAGKPTLCTALDGACPMCDKKNKPSFRFRINAVVKEGDQYVGKIWEQGWTVYENLIGINTDYPLEKTALKITRRGSGPSDTTYIVVPSPQPLNEAALTLIAAVKPLDLTNFESPSKENIPPPTDEDIPF